jgi:cobalt-zinc-cadmium efflux system outer membrane protein
MRGVFAFACVLSFIAGPSRLSAESLTAKRVVEIAAASSPESRIAASRVREAEGRLSGARVIARDNPTIEGLRGTTDNDVQSTELDLTVPLGLGFRRMYRVREARAAVQREQHLEVDSQRQAVARALQAFYGVLFSEQRLSIASDARELAQDLVRIAGERVHAGDAARLDVIIAEGELSRATSEVLEEEARVAEARALLAAILGFPSGSSLEIAGNLEDRSLFGAEVDSATIQTRADILAAKSEVEAAAAAVSGAKAEIVPELAFRMDYEEIGEEDLVRPGLAMSVPIFNWGQGEKGEAKARRQRASIELESQTAIALAEYEGARAAYRNLDASAKESEKEALPRAREVEELTTESYAAGKLDLPSLLVIRRNAVETRQEHAHRQLEAALAGIDLGLAAGTFTAQGE